jgi:RNA polymerase sigma factor (sigma-70 family)
VASGDDRAFEVVYERFGGELSRYCTAMTRHSQDAEDALQATMLNAYRALRSGRRALVLRRYLYRIAHNECVDLLARRGDGAALDDELPAGVAVDEVVERRERLRQLRADLASLPVRQRSALLLRELHGLPHAAIAEVLEASPVEVRSLVHEARQSLTEYAVGRDTACSDLRRRLSEGDRRVMRSRQVKGHLRACELCRLFALEQEERRRGLAILFPPIPLLGVEEIVRASVGTQRAEASVGGGGRRDPSKATQRITQGAAAGLGTLAVVSIGLAFGATPSSKRDVTVPPSGASPSPTAASSSTGAAVPAVPRGGAAGSPAGPTTPAGGTLAAAVVGAPASGGSPAGSGPAGTGPAGPAAGGSGGARIGLPGRGAAPPSRRPGVAPVTVRVPVRTAPVTGAGGPVLVGPLLPAVAAAPAPAAEPAPAPAPLAGVAAEPLAPASGGTGTEASLPSGGAASTPPAAGPRPTPGPPPSGEPPAVDPPATEPPAVDQPPVDQPPVDQPPVDQPPVDQPPVDQPPVDQPPVDQPPLDQPPVDQPPVDQPPRDQPPVDQPPVDQPPVDQPPVDQPPVDQPPVDQPPVDQPPVDQPPVDQPPVDQPPVDQPPVEKPPVDQPPDKLPADEKPPVDTEKPPVDNGGQQGDQGTPGDTTKPVETPPLDQADQTRSDQGTIELPPSDRTPADGEQGTVTARDTTAVEAATTDQAATATVQASVTESSAVSVRKDPAGDPAGGLPADAGTPGPQARTPRRGGGRRRRRPEPPEPARRGGLFVILLLAMLVALTLARLARERRPAR